MIIYGDHDRLECAADIREEVAEALRRVDRSAPGIVRHGALVSAFIRAAELAQGVADAHVEETGRDEASAPGVLSARMLARLAGAIDRSWRSLFASDEDFRSIIHEVEALPVEGLVRTRTGEGYAYYGLYPESYLDAARASGLGSDTRVIGIRSIGIGLGALVAAALRAPPAISLRPVGPPFEREIRADPALIGAGAGDPRIAFAVVDEGPGLSGSSMASVAQWLHEQGVGHERIHFFPSHAGQPGPEASPAVRAIWREVHIHPAEVHDIVLHPHGLRHWLEATIGPLDGPLQPFVPHGHGSAPQDWRFTPRKYVATAGGARWVARFAGLGPIGERRFRDASALGRAGFGPETAALAHGFLVQRWIDGRPIGPFGNDRPALLARLSEYLAFRGRNFGEQGPGATLQRLADMATHNCKEALGSDASALLAARLTGAETLQPRVRPMRTDNRLHSWKWLATHDGILKLDAVDHCEGHDLIGCQDIAWDVCGAIVELDLDENEASALMKDVERIGGIPTGPDLVAFLLPCYLAFQLGLWSTATPTSPEAEELAARYANKLRRWINRDSEAIVTGP